MIIISYLLNKSRCITLTGKPYKVLADIIFSDDNRYINSLNYLIEVMILSLCGHNIFLLPFKACVFESRRINY